MRVKDLIEILQKCNPEATMGIEDINFGNKFSDIDKEDIIISNEEILISVSEQKYLEDWMKLDSIYHHGNNLKNGIMEIKISKNANILPVPIPQTLKELNCLEAALAYIFDDKNLQRITGFKDSEGKSHRFSFSDCCGIMVCEYFFDTEKEVISWAKCIMSWRILNKVLREIEMTSLGGMIKDLIIHKHTYSVENFLLYNLGKKYPIIDRELVDSIVGE